MIAPDELKALIAGSHLICVRCDASGVIRAATPASQERLGPLIGKTWEEVTGSPFRRGQSTERCPGGPASLPLLFDHHDLEDGRISLGCDLREQLAAECEARETERQLDLQKTALDQHAIVAITDPRGRITYANEKFVEISGYELPELLGQDHRILNSGRHPKDFFRALWGTIGRGEVWRGEICNRAKGGHLYWVDTTIVPFTDTDGEILQYVAIRADITARKEHEIELRLLANLVSSSQDAIVRESLSGTITAWNPGAEKLYGRSAREALGRPLAELFPDASESTRASERPTERTRPHAEGGQLQVSETVSPVLDEAGEVVAWVRISRDVGARKRMQARLAQASKFAALGELAGNIAHEVNNPIGVVSGKARLLLSREELSPKVERELGKIVEQCDRISRLTRGLLDYCRPAGGTRSQIDAQVHIRKAAAFVDSRAQRRQVTIELKLLADPPLVHAEGSELQQVFLNLLLNGIDALSAEGGKIRVETRRGTLKGQPALEAVVSDDGPGIPPEIQDRVFEPFFTTREGQGTGLGLAICQRLVEGEGGEIRLGSTPEGGACFELAFPLSA